MRKQFTKTKVYRNLLKAGSVNLRPGSYKVSPFQGDLLLSLDDILKKRSDRNEQKANETNRKSLDTLEKDLI